MFETCAVKFRTDHLCSSGKFCVSLAKGQILSGKQLKERMLEWNALQQNWL